MPETMQEMIESALRCKTKEEAENWVNKRVAEYMKYMKTSTGKTEQELRKILLANLGYLAGYYNQATATKILTLFGAKHPIFGVNYFGESK